MDENLTCVVCGGTNFYKESGFYFCNECQTQTQETREHAFEEFDANHEIKAVRKIDIKTKRQQLNQVKLTTWECYNYVLKGLTEELIILGADVLLRSVVKKLWLKYLLKIEVLNMEKPKLQAVNMKIDAEIVYGKRKKRKRKPRSSKSSKISNSDLSSLDSAALKRERSKKRKALIEAQYKHSQSKSMDSSLLNETLTSLKTSSSQSSQSSVPLRYNEYAIKELRRRQSERHLHLHSEDFENTMKCHKNSYTEASTVYQNSPQLLSINKIYSILYLGLLLTKSKIQLSDMLRFIREGNLSFNSYKHFFPEEMKDNFLTQSFPRKSSLSSASLRRSTYKIAKFLDVLTFLEVQNLVLLIEKFCHELNLPRVIEQHTLNTLMISQPKMKITSKIKWIPNYEGRALSFILFQLKLFIGIDGKTEKYFSEFAQNLNQQHSLPSEMFDFMNWLQFLDYRDHVLRRLYFPTQFSSNKQVKNGNLFVRFILFKNHDYDKLDPSRKYNKSADDCRQLLLKLKSKQENIEDPIYFSPSLTPSIDYVNAVLKDQYVSEVEKKILRRNFSDCKIDAIKNISNFVPLLTEAKRVKVKLRGANSNVKLSKLTNYGNLTKSKLKDGRSVNLVKIKTLDDNTSDVNASVTSFSSSIRVESIDEYIDQFKENHNHSERLNKDESFSDISSGDISVCEESYFTHFKPHERYWVNTNCNFGKLSKRNFQEHMASYPSNFQFILREMARIGEQNTQDLLSEFSLTEIYLLYEEKFQHSENENFDTIYHDKAMRNLLRRAKTCW